jgi:hypothetical protein
MTWPLRSLGSLHRRVVHSRRVRVLAAHFAELIPGRHSVLDVGCRDGLIDVRATRPPSIPARCAIDA